MPAARYWRIVGLESYDGGDLELSELHLYGAGGRLDDGATLTCTVAPSSGTLAALKDDDVGTTCRFAGAAVRSGGFALVWDFGAGNTADAVGVRLGAAAQDVFMAGCTLQYSTDGAQWVWIAAFARYEWPGAGAYTIAPVVGEPDYNKVSLLLHFDGANGSTAFTDNSPVPKTVTAYGNANISTTQSKWGGSSLAISGGSDYLSTPSSSSFDFAAQDFCVELYVRFSAVSGTQVLVTNRSSTINDPGFYLRLNAGVIQGLCWGPTAGTQFGTITGTTAITTAKWYHVAYCRSGGAFRLFVDGVLQGSVTSSAAIADSTYPLVVGKDPTVIGREFFGHIDDLRITKGAARYATNFTPPSAPFPDTEAAGGALFLPPTVRTADSAVQIAASAPVHAFSTSAPHALATARDVAFGGAGVVSATVKRDADPVDLPMRRRVRLFDERSGLLVRETWSEAATGAYSFAGLDAARTYTAVAYDHDHACRAVIADNLTPEVPA